jgi:hypothetical protein
MMVIPETLRARYIRYLSFFFLSEESGRKLTIGKCQEMRAEKAVSVISLIYNK